MALRDIFDSDKRSKEDLRSEIRSRDLQIDQLKQQAIEIRLDFDSRITTGQISNVQQAGAVVDDHTQFADAALYLNQINDLNKQLIDEKSRVEWLSRVAEEQEIKLNKELEKRREIARELGEERAKRIEIAAKNQQEYGQLLTALQVLKAKSETASAPPATNSAATQETILNLYPASPSPKQPQQHDRKYYSEAHRILMEREDRVSAMEESVGKLLQRFGLTDKSQITDIPSLVKDLEREREVLLRSSAVEELTHLRAQLADAKVRVDSQSEELRDIKKSLIREREINSQSESNRLRRMLDDAEIEIKKLKGGFSDEVWTLKRKAESAEKKVQDREFDFRNLGLRVEDLEKKNIVFRKEIARFEANYISVEAHRNECLQLERQREFQKNEAAKYLKYFNDAERRLDNSIDQAGQLKNKLNDTKSSLDYASDQVEKIKKKLNDADGRSSSAKLQIEQLKNDLETERKRSLVQPSRIKSSFLNPTVFRWLIEGAGPDSAAIANSWLGYFGYEPFDESVFFERVSDIGYCFYEMPEDKLSSIIVGRKGWSKNSLIAQIDAREGEPLRIYSQEMFIAKLITGRDPFDAGDRALLESFAAGHPALEFLMDRPLPWPTVCEGEGLTVILVDGEEYGVSESPLHKLGYRVGATSQYTDAARRELLTECFQANKLEFSDDSNPEYCRKWGRGQSAQRLYRMAVHIKFLADGWVGKDPRKPQARIDWVNDLEWLKKNYYASMKQKFSWP